MVRKELDEMEKYRATALRSRRSTKGGKRKNDSSDTFFAIGWVLEALLLLAMGMWLLSACAARYL